MDQINLCVECGVDMGYCNPRQYCGKTYCENEKYITELKDEFSDAIRMSSSPCLCGQVRYHVRYFQHSLGVGSTDSQVLYGEYFVILKVIVRMERKVQRAI